MIVKDGFCYLYRHIRLDTNEVFYVGVGVKRHELEEEYYRAYNKDNRNKFWKNITAKTDYRVEILLESDDYEFILVKEKEFVKIYGRRNLGLGTLVNLTDGGKVDLNTIINCKPVYQFDLDFNLVKKWQSAYHIVREFGGTLGGIYKCTKVKDGYKTYKEYIWSSSLEFSKVNKNAERETAQYDLDGNLIKTFKSLKQASIELNLENTAIRQSVLKNRPCSNFQFRYFNKIPLPLVDKLELKFNISGINQYDLEGNFIRYWSKVTDITKELGFLGINIIKTAKYQRKSSNGFQWRYANDDTTVSKVIREKEIQKKAILQYDLNMNFIKEYESAREACRQLKLNYKKLSYAKIRNKEYGGFYWKDK